MNASPEGHGPNLDAQRGGGRHGGWQVRAEPGQGGPMVGTVAQTDVGLKGLPWRRAPEWGDARLRISYLIILNLVERRARTLTR